MRIDIILPYKEIFSKNKASAVSLTVKNSAEFSKFKNYIRVFGQFVNDPFLDLKFTGIKINKILHLGNNRSILFNYIKIYNKEISENRIIEIHNRPYLFNIAIKKNIKDPITLHFHNDPRTMKGSKQVSERNFIAKNAAAVYFVSQYIKDCFLEGLENYYDNLHVLPNGIQRKLAVQPKKKKQILFIGRLVPEKGCHLFIEAIRDLVHEFPEWQFKILGSPKAGNNSLDLSYSKKIIETFISFGKNTKYFGFVPNDEVKKILEDTSILVVPSVWQDPFPLTALEGICSGAAVIASKVGGISEMLVDTGFLIEDINEKKLKHAIKKLILDKKLLQDYQNKSWKNYKYNQTEIVMMQDKYRSQIIQNYKMFD